MLESQEPNFTSAVTYACELGEQRDTADFAKGIKLYLSKSLANSRNGSFNLKDLLDNMPTAIGHSRVYCPNQWEKQGYFVQAVYNNTHIWQELAPEYDQMIIRIQRGEIDD